MSTVTQTIPEVKAQPIVVGESGRAQRVADVRAAYHAALLKANPSPEQLAWRLGRYERGLKLYGEVLRRGVRLQGNDIVDLGAAHGGDACAAMALGARSVTLADFRDHAHATLTAELQPYGELRSRLFEMNQNWPLSQSGYDGLLAMSVLEHVHDINAFFEKVYGVLRPGGFAIVQTAMALPSVRRDGLFGTPGTALFPMPLRKFCAERFFRRQYSCPLANHTFYSAGAILKAAGRAGLTGEACKYSDSPLMRRASHWPMSATWRGAIRHFCTDYLLLRKP